MIGMRLSGCPLRPGYGVPSTAAQAARLLLSVTHAGRILAYCAGKRILSSASSAERRGSVNGAGVGCSGPALTDQGLLGRRLRHTWTNEGGFEPPLRRLAALPSQLDWREGRGHPMSGVFAALEPDGDGPVSAIHATSSATITGATGWRRRPGQSRPYGAHDQRRVDDRVERDEDETVDGTALDASMAPAGSAARTQRRGRTPAGRGGPSRPATGPGCVPPAYSANSSVMPSAPAGSPHSSRGRLARRSPSGRARRRPARRRHAARRRSGPRGRPTCTPARLGAGYRRPRGATRQRVAPRPHRAERDRALLGPACFPARSVSHGHLALSGDAPVRR